MSAASCAVTLNVQRVVMISLSELPLSARVANSLVSYARYLGKAFWPQELYVPYTTTSAWPAATVVLAAVLVAVICFVAVWQWRRRPYLAVGWFWFLGTLIPVIGLVQVGAQAMADRYTYLPLVGVFVAVT